MLEMLNRLTWNTRGWRMPTANSADGGYPSANGFGHEEWNFQTEDAIDGYIYGWTYYSNPSADVQSRSGGVFDIGFWSMHPDTHDKMLVGSYKSATIVSDNDMKKICNEFKKRGFIKRRADELVAVLPKMSIATALKKIEDALSKPYIKWRCPVELVIVYEPMISLPSSIGSKKIGFYFAKPTIVNYTSVFNSKSKEMGSFTQLKRNENMGRTSPLAEEAYYRESASNLRTIIPRHNKLSNQFCNWLSRSGVNEMIQEKGQVHISFNHQGKSHLAELKVCYGVGTTKAIREAIGQLFEYNYYSKKSPRELWLIVLDDKASTNDIAFIAEISKNHNLPIHLGWKDGENSFYFSDNWKP